MHSTCLLQCNFRTHYIWQVHIFAFIYLHILHSVQRFAFNVHVMLRLKHFQKIPPLNRVYTRDLNSSHFVQSLFTILMFLFCIILITLKYELFCSIVENNNNIYS